ncbi:MAG: hypothetical protein QMD99_17315 [Rhizobiaceae bacterium]|nr:hypothetical protein [Rhizobiaceae bacterium]
MTSRTAPPRNPIADVIGERNRHITEEGWTENHDDQHTGRELAAAAEGYLTSAISRADGEDVSIPPEGWPFAPEWWKPKGYYADLKRAAALILAEMERVDRLAEREGCRCEACNEPLYEGDPYFDDFVNGGAYHAHCMGEDIDAFTDAEGNPLPPGTPRPQPSRYVV